MVASVQGELRAIGKRKKGAMKKMSVDESACQAIPWGKSCSKGNWCCLDASGGALKSACEPCTTAWWSFGHCIDTPDDSCGKHNMKAWNSLADIEQAAAEAGSAFAKQELKKLICKYTGQEC